MTKSDDPFNNLLEIMENAGEPNSGAPFFIGTVRTSNPLTVEIGDIAITRDNMRINQTLSSGLRSGEEVALLASADGQQYILLCRVV